MNKLIIANWKMNPTSVEEAIALAKTSDAAHVVVAPPFVFLERVHAILKKSALAAQDVFFEDVSGNGAFTGEISAAMLKSLGVEYVIIGHSERRALGDTDEIVNKKICVALEAGIAPILCVGELKRELGSNKKYELRKAMSYVKKQLRSTLKCIQNSHLRPATDGQAKFKIQNSLIIAYEPVWAIGTGKSDTPQNAAEMIKYIKNLLTTTYLLQPTSRQLPTKVLYGGSVNEKNIAAFANESEIDGFLIGGASLRSDEFKKMIKIISHIS